MSRINFFKRTYFSNFLCLGFCLCLVSADSNTTNVQNVGDKSKESYEEYEANDRDLIDDVRIYDTGENIEKGIRKFDRNVESEEKSKNVTSSEINDKVTDSSSVADDVKIYDTDEKLKDEEEEGVFEDSEANQNANISGTLVAKMMPEILKYNGRMVLPSSEEQDTKQNQRIERRSDIVESKSVIQKLSRSKIDTEPKDFPTAGASFARNASRLDEILDLFNPYRLYDIWQENDEFVRLSLTCHAEMEVYLMSLKRAESWALKGEF